MSVAAGYWFVRLFPHKYECVSTRIAGAADVGFVVPAKNLLWPGLEAWDTQKRRYFSERSFVRERIHKKLSLSHSNSVFVAIKIGVLA